MEPIESYDRLYEPRDSIEEIVLREREIHGLAQICLDCFRDWAVSRQTPPDLVQDVCNHCSVIEALSIFAQATIIHINSCASWPSLDFEESNGGFFPPTGDDEPLDMREVRLRSWISMIPALLDGYIIWVEPFREGYTERFELTNRLIDSSRQWARLAGHSERRIRQAFDERNFRGRSIFKEGCYSLADQLSGKLEQRIQYSKEGMLWSSLGS